MRLVLSLGLLACSVALAFSQTQHSGHGAHHPPAVQQAQPAAPQDTRIFVAIPEPMNSHMLANMRDHLAALEEIQSALASDNATLAARTAEKRLGMSSLETHGAHHVGQFMPEGMRQAGTAMHRAASRFATVATDAGVSGDLKPALAALSEVTRACVGCHAGYKTR